MALDVEVGALIGGCVAGGVVFIIFVAVIIYLLCGKRRRKKEERQQQKFRQLTPHTSPAHSQPSSLSQAAHPIHPPLPSDQPPRLPKVGSYGLWVGAPGIYASTPSPAYAYGGGGGRSGGKPHPLMQPAVMQKASSDPRLLHSRGPGGHMVVAHVPARRAVSLLRVYSAGGGQQRIYHSQGIPSPLSPVYEIRDPNDGSVYDVYQIGGGSATRLLQDSSKSSGKRVQRSQSDVVSEPSRRAYRTKPSPAQLRASRASSSYRETSPGSTVKEDTSNMQSVDSVEKDTQQQGGVENPMLIEHVEKIMQEDKVAVAASATDSMKLLAKNKTDDQKTVRRSSASENLLDGDPSGNATSSAVTPEPPASPTLHYAFQGDIYAVPDKEAIRSRSTSSDPSAPGAVEAAVPERSATVMERGTTDPLADISDITDAIARSLVIDDDFGYAAAPILWNPIYQDVREPLVYERSVTQSSIYPEVGDVADRESEDKPVVNATVGAGDVAVPMAGNAVGTLGVARVSSGEMAAVASAATSAGDVGASGQAEEQRKLWEQWRAETEGISDELTRAGKHISLTAEAFEFLDTYLSDEDYGTDVNSPPMSPILTDRSEGF